ncbi:hypothetical protein NPX13_g7341 [Xylaria arbuscula]|uniref:Uncharacterized protein n=1 Tax=Xylaria arbuscula TaxID=114810 RepID=A0A9W8NAN8_9PEZI|nr:hypothetical protein NPX13_g7341 [Xylaria arbuscula]
MEDAVRPNDEAFKAYYEKGYATWFRLWEKANRDYNIPEACLQFDNIYPQHPFFTTGLQVDDSGSVFAKTCWVPAEECCDLTSFEQQFQLHTTLSRPVTISLREDSWPFPKWLQEDSHLTVLVLAWAYVLSARWAEIIPRASAIEYLESMAPWNFKPTGEQKEGNLPTVVLDVGDVNDKAARWWSAILAPGQGWKGRIPHERYTLQPPWATKIEADASFTLAGADISEKFISSSPASCTDAVAYIEEYVAIHNADRHSRIAFATALLLPLANMERRKVTLPLSQPSGRKGYRTPPLQFPIWGKDLSQLDRLLTLSCNFHGLRAILGSIFYESDIPSNLCGAWIQGTAALLQSDLVRDPHILASIIFHRSPQIACLWLGGIVSGAHLSFIRSRFGLFEMLSFNRIDLQEAVWTGTLQSFIQEPVSRVPEESTHISRADECRLMYLSQELDKETRPCYPYPPFGDIPICDAALVVQAHARCPGNHCLRYSSITWPCESGRKEVQAASELLLVAPTPRTNDGLHESSIEINYEKLDRVKDQSDSVTRNIFLWMREMDGYPVSEREIYRHELIWDSDDSDSESLHAEGDGMSTAGWNTPMRTGKWLSGVATKRCNSF